MDRNSMISIIVPVYNAAKYIKDTIDSVLLQDYENFEVILVNDCSTDESIKIIDSYRKDPRIRLISNTSNQGAAASRNIGISEANGDFITFLDSDDVWDSHKLSKELTFMKSKDIAFAFTSYEFGDENAKGTGKYVNVPAQLTYKEALSRTVIFTSTVMFDMSKLTKDDIKMPLVASEDTATWWKLLRNGHTAYGLNESLVIYRRPSASLSSNKIVAIKRIWNLYRNVEKLNLVQSIYNLCFWAIRATLRRI